MFTTDNDDEWLNTVDTNVFDETQLRLNQIVFLSKWTEAVDLIVATLFLSGKKIVILFFLFWGLP